MLTLSQSLVDELNKFMAFSDNNEKNSIYHPIYVKIVGREAKEEERDMKGEEKSSSKS